MLNLAVFVSGNGSDMQSIIDGIASGYITDTKIKLVIASKDGIFAIKRAENNNIQCKIFKKQDYEDTSAMFEDIKIALRDASIDYIVLAGYLTILTPNIVKAYPNKIINIHPSLIPEFCGDGFYGIKVHQAVIDSGKSYSGCTVHFVDEGTDTGEIILQEKVEVKAGDTAETLASRVLQCEHQVLVKAIKLVADKHNK